MNARLFSRKVPKKRRHRKRGNNSIFKPAQFKPRQIYLPSHTLSSIQFKNLHEKIRTLSKAKNLASGETLTPEEIGRVLGVHPVEVREIRKKLGIDN